MSLFASYGDFVVVLYPVSPNQPLFNPTSPIYSGDATDDNKWHQLIQKAVANFARGDQEPEWRTVYWMRTPNGPRVVGPSTPSPAPAGWSPPSLAGRMVDLGDMPVYTRRAGADETVLIPATFDPPAYAP